MLGLYTVTAVPLVIMWESKRSSDDRDLLNVLETPVQPKLGPIVVRLLFIQGVMLCYIFFVYALDSKVGPVTLSTGVMGASAAAGTAPLSGGTVRAPPSVFSHIAVLSATARQGRTTK